MDSYRQSTTTGASASQLSYAAQLDADIQSKRNYDANNQQQGSGRQSHLLQERKQRQYQEQAMLNAPKQVQPALRNDYAAQLAQDIEDRNRLNTIRLNRENQSPQHQYAPEYQHHQNNQAQQQQYQPTEQEQYQQFQQQQMMYQQQNQQAQQQYQGKRDLHTPTNTEWPCAILAAHSARRGSRAARLSR